MSFGLRNAPSTFQRFINEMFLGLDFFPAYLDDILFASSTEDEHSEYLKVVFSRLVKYAIRINLGQSVMEENRLEFLGYMITSEGSKSLPEKVNAILNYGLPEIIHEMRTFLSLINFNRRYIKDSEKIQAVHHEYLKALFTDASDHAFGSVLQQFEEDSWKHLAFFPRKLSNAQKGYSTCYKEQSGIYLSIKQFKHILERRHFTVCTVHKPLMSAFQQKNEKASPRQLGHLQYISELYTDIRHIGGKENIFADSLSRIESIPEIDYDKIADAQIDSKDLNELRSKPSLHFKQYSSDSGKLLWCDISTTKIRPFIPQDFRMHIFQKIHSLAHPGVKSRVKQIASRFIWINIRKDITQWAKSFIHCQKNKINRHTRAQIATYIEVDDRFSVINIDIIGLFPTSEGRKYCFTCIDRFTCWIEVIPFANLTAEIVARIFYDYWISRLGMPYCVITDQGSEFRSELFKNIGVICRFKILADILNKRVLSIRTCILVHVFIRFDGVRKPLEPPYDGSFPVLRRHEMHSAVTIKGKDINTSADRLKPAYLLLADVDVPYPKKIDTSPALPNKF
ncbi:Transposon Tf2-6 polyprotein [Araneus ventricosus]|uniref:RNA-directed DNA polymerase n=1 Tax=Araneus ventricosus TaxID=182803 RepID=A0A4Y2IBV8_ARAVE|nr:Transposon Tf2-6 polyprotein [Araneus ventricosus]